MATATECELCGTLYYAGQEVHEHEAVIIREGSSTRTADELAEQFVIDVIGLGEFLPDSETTAFLARIDSLLDGTLDHHWLAEPQDSEDLRDLAIEAENAMSAHAVVWDDGYVIYDVREPDTDDDDDDDPADAPSGFLPLGTGGLRDEVAYAESFADDE